MLLLTLRDLLHRKTRFIVVTMLGAVVFALLFVLNGLVNQLNSEPYDTLDAIGADFWVVPEGVAGPFTSLSAAPAASLDAVQAETKYPGVMSRSSIRRDESDGGTAVILVGHVPDGLGAPRADEGRAITGDDEVVVSSSLDVEIGEEVTVGGIPMTVVGRSDHATLLAGVPMAFVSLPVAQEITFRTDEVISAVLVDGEVDGLPPGAKAMTSDDVAADVRRPLDSAITSIDLVRILLWIIAGIIIGAVVYLSALERQRDFAVLKAIGAPNSALLGSLGVQAVLMALFAVAIGAFLQLFLTPQFPLPVSVPTSAFWQLPLLAVVMALVAGLVGMRKVMRSDPSQAFSGAGV
jgi:putative ABC transport system permease protein